MQLVRLTAAVSGLAPPDADKRVTQVLTDARNAASQARSSAVILGFCSRGRTGGGGGRRLGRGRHRRQASRQ